MNDRGYVMVVVLVSLAMLMAMAVALAQVATAEMRIAGHLRDGATALGIAEAGLEQALVQISADPRWRDGWDWTEYGGGSHALDVEVDDSLVSLISTGIYSDVRRQVRVLLRAAGHEAFQHAIYATGDLVSDGFLEVSGDVLVGGDFYNSGTATVDGDLLLGGSVIGDDPTVTGEVVLDPDPQPLPAETLDWYRENADLILPGPVVLSGVIDYDCLVVIEGDLRIGQPPNLTATVYGTTTLVVTGSVRIRGQVRYNDPLQDMLLVLAAGDIETWANATVEAFLLSNTRVESRGNLTLLGGIVAPAVELGGRGAVTLDERFYQTPLPGTSGIEIEVLDWRQTQ